MLPWNILKLGQIRHSPKLTGSAWRCQQPPSACRVSCRSGVCSGLADNGRPDSPAISNPHPAVLCFRRDGHYVRARKRAAMVCFRLMGRCMCGRCPTLCGTSVDCGVRLICLINHHYGRLDTMNQHESSTIIPQSRRLSSVQSMAGFTNGHS